MKPQVEVEGVPVPVASAEDIVVMKVLAGRPKDIDDVIADRRGAGTHAGLRMRAGHARHP